MCQLHPCKTIRNRLQEKAVGIVARSLLLVQDEKEIGYGKCSDYHV